MRWFRLGASGLAAGVLALAASAAQADELEIIFWGDRALEWLQVDGVSHQVRDSSVTVRNISGGQHTITYGSGGASRTISLYLSGGNTARTGAWCLSLYLDKYELLDGAACEEMWDYYFSS